MADYSRYDRLEKEMSYREEKFRSGLSSEQQGALPPFMSKGREKFKKEEEEILNGIQEGKVSQWDAMLGLTRLMEQYYGKGYES